MSTKLKFKVDQEQIIGLMLNKVQILNVKNGDIFNMTLAPEEVKESTIIHDFFH